MTNQPAKTPVLTLLFPLYKSARFLNNLVAHLDQITSTDTNIIVSDRHGYDDTLEVLKTRYGNDPRFSFLAATDGINWVKHYNFLIDQVTGKYFAFVPHDDVYLPDYFEVLVKELEKKPSAALAFSQMEVAGDNNWVPDYSIFREDYKYPFRSAEYIKLLYSNIIGVAFRGVFRTAIVQNEKLYIKEAEQVTMFQDYYWIFALLERGDFIYSEKTSCTKFFRNDGASGNWDYKKFFKTNKAARKILYDYTFASPLPVSTKLNIYSGLELRRLKVRVTRMVRSLKQTK